MSAANQQHLAHAGARGKHGKPKDRYVQVFFRVLNSHAWRALSPTEHSLWLSLRYQFNGGNNGNISATLAALKHRGVSSSATLAKSLRAMMAVGLIAKTRDTGGLTHAGAVCCLYRFTDLPCPSFPDKGITASRETHDYARFTTVAEAKAVIKAAHASAKRPDHPNASRTTLASKLQILNGSSSDIEVVQFKSRTGVPPNSSPSERCRPVRKARESTAVIGETPKNVVASELARHASETEHLYSLPGSASAARCLPATTRLGRLLQHRIHCGPRQQGYIDARTAIATRAGETAAVHGT